MLITELLRLQKSIGKVVSDPAQIEAIIEAIGIEEQFSAYQDRAGKTKRAQHTKQHGTVSASFQVNDELPEELQVGLFQAGQQYDCQIRFSNGATQIAPDSYPGLQGMAIKLFGVQGEYLLPGEKAQDFLTMSYPFFFLRDMVHVGEAMKAQVAGKEAVEKFFSENPESYKLMQAQKGYYLNPLQVQFYSVSPYSFGDRKVKYSISPVVSENRGSYPKSAIPDNAPPNYLQQAMADQLAQGEVVFEFLIQFYQDEESTPMDNAMVTWETPFVKVAKIAIPEQYFTAPGQLEKSDLASYNPWHCLKAHAPLGSINLGRRFIYQELAAYRHDRDVLSPHAPKQNPLNLILEIKKDPVQIKSVSGEIVVDTKGLEENYQVLRAALADGGTGLDSIKTIHFARNIFLEPVKALNEDGNEVIAYYKTVALITSYDQGFADYIIDFAEAIYERFNFLLSFVEGTEEIKDDDGNIKVQKNIRSFVKFIGDHNQETVAYYCSYPDLSVVQIVQNEMARNPKLTNQGRCPLGFS